MLQVPAKSLNDDSLYLWLSAQAKLLAQGQLPSAHASQLMTLGVEPDRTAVPSLTG